MMEHDFLKYAGILTTKEIDDIISRLNQIKESRADITRRTAARKVIDAIDEYLKLGEDISIEGEKWNVKCGYYKNVETTLNGYSEKDGYLTFTFIE